MSTKSRESQITDIKDDLDSLSPCETLKSKPIKMFSAADKSGSTSSENSSCVQLDQGTRNSDSLKAAFTEMENDILEAIADCKLSFVTCKDGSGIQAVFPKLVQYKSSLSSIVKDMKNILLETDLINFTRRYQQCIENIIQVSETASAKILELDERSQCSQSYRPTSKRHRSARTVSSVKSTMSGESKVSSKKEFFDLQKDVAAMEATKGIRKQQFDLQIQKEIAEKKARALVCLQAEEAENPFSVDVDLMRGANNYFNPNNSCFNANSKSSPILNEAPACMVIDPQIELNNSDISNHDQVSSTVVDIPCQASSYSPVINPRPPFTNVSASQEAVSTGIVNVGSFSLPPPNVNSFPSVPTVSNVSQNVFNVSRVASAPFNCCTQTTTVSANSGSLPTHCNDNNISVPTVNSAALPPQTCNLSHDMTNLMSNILSVQRAPVAKVRVFDGDPLQYPQWESSFKKLVEQRLLDDADKMNLLERHLTGEPKSMVEGLFLLQSENSYERAKKALKDRYGDDSVISVAFRTKLASWPKIGPNDIKGMLAFSDFLQQIVEVKKVVEDLKILDFPSELCVLIKRVLPSSLFNRWKESVYEWKCKFNVNTSDNLKVNCPKYPPFEEFAKFILKRASVMHCPEMTVFDENLNPSKYNTEQNSKSNHSRYGHRMNKNSFSTNVSRDSCLHCNGSHKIGDCQTFLRISLVKRRKLFWDNFLCYSCGVKMSKGHSAKSCKNVASCRKCNKGHLTCFHVDNKPEQTESNQSFCSEVCSIVDQHDGVDQSMIIPVWVKGNTSKEVLCYCLLDGQSNTSFITGELQQQLGLKGVDTQISLSTMSSRNDLIQCKVFKNIQVSSYDHKDIISVPRAYTRDEIPVKRSQIPKSEVCKKWKHLADVAKHLMPYMPDLPVSMLIGSNAPNAIRPRDIIAGLETEPYAQRSILGWGVVGKVCHGDDDCYVSHRMLACGATSKVDPGEKFVFSTKVKEVLFPNQVCSMFNADFVEHCGNQQNMSAEDHRFLKILSDGITKKDGHYKLPLPLRSQQINLPNNLPLAQKRLEQLKKRMLRDQKYKNDYYKFMSDIIENYAERVPDDEVSLSNGSVNYVPHLGVYHPKKPDKIRVVFDCSAKYGGVCLNDYLLPGPDQMNSLLGILLRFRMERVAVKCDIKAFFHQFLVDEPHRDLLRFLWWDNSDMTGNLCHYKLKIHLFGAISSPGCASFGLKHAADDGESSFGKEAADFIRNEFYVDDGLTSKPNAEDAIELIKNSTNLCSSAGLNLCKIMSNSREVLESVPQLSVSPSVQCLDPKSDPLPVERALGVDWLVESDCLCFRIDSKVTPVTRRGILSAVSSVYDPIGLVAPVILEGKKILQALCKDCYDWDEPIPEIFRVKWEKWQKDLCHLVNLRVDRCYKPVNFGNIKHVELHHFSDASESGYGQCTYLRLVNDCGKAHCALVIGKARVAPLKHVTIPRLELTAAVVSARMSNLVKTELKLKNATEFFWVDSMVVLGYIQNESKRFNVFVANRVQTIHNFSSPSSWHHVPTKANPSDDASRGLQADQLNAGCRWLNGPEFLWCEGKFVPPLVKPEQNDEVILEVQKEMKGCSVHRTIAFKADCSGKDFDISRLNIFSSWFKAKRAVANCIKYKDLLKNPKSAFQKVTSDDLCQAENLIIFSLQRSYFSKDLSVLKNSDCSDQVSFKNRFSRLDPFLDNSGIVRVGGRIRNSIEEFKVKHPVVLPRKGHVTSIIIHHFHVRGGHMGRYMTLNAIRQSGYWILGGTSAVSQQIHACVPCKKIRGNPHGQKMADLPKDRFNLDSPFTYCGMDIFGHFFIKEKRSMLKRWVILFICLSSRAVHLESLNSMSTDSFINALRRFTARRGPVKQLRCDCGSNFIGASNELRKAYKEFDQVKIKNFLLQGECDWVDFKFGVPNSSHMQGFVERQIRTVRSALEPLFLQFGHILCEESFRTVLVEAEQVVNSKPLAVANLSDPLAPEPLTPNHILTLKPKVLLPPPGNFQKSDQYLLKRWRRVQYLVNEFWYRYRRECLHLLQERQKWVFPKRNLALGDIVHVIEDGSPRNSWKLGKVVEVFPSGDGLVRKVRLQLATSLLTTNGKRVGVTAYLDRPVHKLVLLIANEGSRSVED
ncbi:uncharacterized protein LOC144425718 [Styela clava]